MDSVISGYSGVIELNGKQWSIGVVDCLSGMIGKGSVLTIGPVGADPNFISELEVSENLFLDGQCYDVVFEFQKTESECPVLQCRLTEKYLPLGKLRIECPGIKYLVLGNEKNAGPSGFESGGCSGSGWGLSVQKTCVGTENISPSYFDEIQVSAEDDYILRAGSP